MTKRILVSALVALTVAVSSSGTGAHEAERRCRDADLPSAACEAVAEAEHGFSRAGLSFADRSEDPAAEVGIVDFAFSPRVTVVRDGQLVEFRNVNRSGGNPHSVSSSDIGGSSPVLAGPVGPFGGGRGFRSGRLAPGEPFLLQVDLATLHPDAYAVLPTGDVLIAFHCYVHGASQMSGQLLVKGAAA